VTYIQTRSSQYFASLASAILDLLCVRLGHPRGAFGDFNCCAKFCRNRLCSFGDMRVSVLCEFGLKMPIHDPFKGVYGGKMGKQETFLAVLSLDECNNPGLIDA